MATLKKRKLTMGKKYLLVFKKYGKTFGTIHNELSPAESNQLNYFSTESYISCLLIQSKSLSLWHKFNNKT